MTAHQRRRGGRRYHVGVGTLLFVALLSACAPAPAGMAVPADRLVPSLPLAPAESLAPSLGRRSVACTLPSTAPVATTLQVAGVERRLIVRDATATPQQPAELVIAFHGRTNSALMARDYFGLDEALPDAIVVYPSALPASANSFAWSDPDDAPAAQRDFALVRAIVDAVGGVRCLDLERVFVVGHSLGAYFANDVACHLSDLVRGVASVAGGIQLGSCSGPVAALIAHHPADALVPISAGVAARDAFLAANGLVTAAPQSEPAPALSALRCSRYGAADTLHPVLWCAHDDAISTSGRYDPHTWPAPTADAIAAFFQQLP